MHIELAVSAIFMNKLNIAITGANGYIGSILSSYLEKQGHSICQMIREPSTNQVKYIQFQLGEKNDYSLLKDIDVLIHCAYDFSLTNYDQLRRVNLEGSVELFKQAKSAGIKNIIFLSSTSAFETTISNYGKIKYELEQHAREMGVTIVRPGLVFSKNAKGIIGSIEKIVIRSPIVPIIGKGDQIFFPCHIEDLSALINYLIVNNAIYSNPITAASEKTITFKELIFALAKAKHKKPTLFPLPYHLLYIGLKMAEICKIPLGLRSDSLKYMSHYNKTPDFSITKEIGINFRPLNLSTL